VRQSRQKGSREPQVVIDEAGKGELRGCFTVEDILQPCYRPNEDFTLPFTGSAAFRIRGGVALRVPGGSQ
ncbi:MAG TPA: hypothetical protein VER55_05810, partial [Ardenticatenaceae bacterium]|nr:hypothetical protein [Ardenticatenaceae bacterium]